MPAPIGILWVKPDVGSQGVAASQELEETCSSSGGGET